MKNSWIVKATSRYKSTFHIVAADSYDEAVKVGQQYTGHRIEKAWPAIGKWQSKHDARVSSEQVCLRTQI
jgi:hypothetical protein